MKEITRRSLLKPRLDTSSAAPVLSAAVDAVAVEGTSRRAFLQGTAGAAAGAAVILATPKVASLALDGRGCRRSAAEPKAVVTEPSGPAPREPVTAYVRDADRGEVTVMSGKQETTYTRPGAREAAARRSSLTPPTTKRGRAHVIASRGAGDQQGPRRRQHRHLRVRQPRQPGDGHDHHQLPPGRGPGRRPDLLRVRQRRPLHDPHRQQRRRTGRHRLRVRLRIDDRQPQHVPLQHRADRLADRPELEQTPVLQRHAREDRTPRSATVLG